MTAFNESIVEEAALAWLQRLGYQVLHGPEIAYGERAAERTAPGFCDVVLVGRLHRALTRLNPDLPSGAINDACRKLTHTEAPTQFSRPPTPKPAS